MYISLFDMSIDLAIRDGSPDVSELEVLVHTVNVSMVSLRSTRCSPLIVRCVSIRKYRSQFGLLKISSIGSRTSTLPSGGLYLTDYYLQSLALASDSRQPVTQDAEFRKSFPLSDPR